ncbi:carbon-nitrogen hydrolase [Jaminaea rosea]|uniref:Carbon-nitrogen hydrolase n=1 Tax=Jaminaea rosea TaxID=1569628 RepID=A0A316USK7_9BASI|nr:carbon-nitrogen hydrolase [Jaminaea rosea]PWN28262.1 carbon-nitrogen hydrolase [Jaminaea rosea]
MALPPGLQALAIGPSNAAATVEFGIDYLCPFSAKLVIGVQHHLLPLIFGSSAPWEGKVRIVLRPYPQPWHASSTLVNEAAIAAAKISRISEPEVIQDPKTNAFWIFSQSLMAKQDAYFDGPSRNRNPDQLRADLANLAVAVLGEAPKKSKSTPIVSLPSGQPLGQTVRNLLKVGEGNEGSKVVPDLKYCVKYGRQNGIHVTPTAIWNGLIEPSISSSFGEKEWRDFLEKNVGPPVSTVALLHRLRGLLGATRTPSSIPSTVTSLAMSTSQAPSTPHGRAGLMRIAVVQMTPHHSNPSASRQRLLDLTAHLSKSDGIHLLIAPEMALTGYVFEGEAGKAKIRGMAERFGSREAFAGESTAHSVAREISQRLGCHTLIGYPEVVLPGDGEAAVAAKPVDRRPTLAGERTDVADSRSSSSSSPYYYNSALLTSPQGEALHTFRKHFLFDADVLWCDEGPGFQCIDLTLDDQEGHRRSVRVGVAICMDINPYRFQTPFDTFELTRWAHERKVDVLAMPMAWLTDYGDEHVAQHAEETNLDSVNYWAARCEPFWRKTGDGHDTEKHTILVTANRTGKEGGSSSVLSFKPGDRPTLMVSLGQAQEATFVYEHHLGVST